MKYLLVNKWYSLALIIGFFSICFGFYGMFYAEPYLAFIKLFGLTPAPPYAFIIVGTVTVFYVIPKIHHHSRVCDIIRRRDGKTAR